MTVEENKAVEYFKKHKNYFEEQIKFIQAVESDEYEEELELYQNRIKQFNIILNLIEKQSKIIDLQINFLYELGVERPGTVFKKLWDNGLDKEKCGYCKDDNLKCTDCIKQYFYRKVEENK